MTSKKEDSNISLDIIKGAQIDLDESIIDVVRDSSFIEKSLTKEGFQNLVAFDISKDNLVGSPNIVGNISKRLRIFEAFKGNSYKKHQFSTWHDRSHFHTLTDRFARKNYIKALKHFLRPGGHLIIGAYAIGGDEKYTTPEMKSCDSKKLLQMLGSSFTLHETRIELQLTSDNKENKFFFYHFIKQTNILRWKIIIGGIIGYNRIKRLYGIYKRSKFSYEKYEPFRQKLFYYLYHSGNLRLINKLLPVFIDGSIFKNVNQIKSFLQRCDKDEDWMETVSFDYKNKLNKLKKNTLNKTSELDEKGYTKVTDIIKIDSSTISDFVNIAMKSYAYDAQVPLQSSLKLKRINHEHHYFSLEPSLKICERFYKPILQNENLKNIINDYLRFKGELYSLNTMVCMPSKVKHGVTNIHRDSDEKHFVVLLILWTEVSYEDGATYFIPESHRSAECTQNGIYLEGLSGEAYLVDTFGLHSGNKKIKKPRVVTWLRFGKREINQTYISNKEYLFSNLYDRTYAT